MKTSGICTKCACRKLYVVDRITQPDHDSSNCTVPLWLMAAPIPQNATGTTGGSSYRSHASMLEAWVCSSCGFTELYSKTLSDLEVLSRHREGGVRVRQATGDAPAPYR
jgi:predicted nucleic-acid-binding Zn-ribbon protein